jgi:ADP-ribose pyrophosphatase
MAADSDNDSGLGFLSGRLAAMAFDPSGPADHLREKLLARTPVFEGRLLRVYQDEVGLPDGRSATREVVHHRGAVAVVPVAPDGRVVLVRQWRHAVERALWEVPAGTRDHPDEEPAATASRELEEETGYTASSWRSLGQVCVSPGYSRELMWFFVASGLREGTAAMDPDETIDVRLFTAAEIVSLVEAGATDLKTLAGLALAGHLPALAGEPVR